MGCFLGCFGVSRKPNRRKPNFKRRGIIEPLSSSTSILSNGDSESPISSSVDFEARSKPKEQLRAKIRKKVSFNLNVQTYEPISVAYHMLKDERDDVKSAHKCEEIAQGFSNLNYRYQNCRDFFDEEDDIFEDSDFDDEYDDDEISDEIEECEVEERRASSSVKEKFNVDRSECVHSVLKPVENLTQWRAAKAKETAAKEKNPMKENAVFSRESQLPVAVPQNCKRPKTLLQEIAVDSSLTAWLNSPRT